MTFECHDPEGDWITDVEREDEERRRAREFDPDTNEDHQDDHLKTGGVSDHGVAP